MRRQGHPRQKRAKRRILSGVIALTAKGVGYVEHEGFPEDIEIATENLRTALHRDTVEVEIPPFRVRGRVQGRVVRVLSRAKSSFVGTLREEGGRWFLAPDDRKFYATIALPPRNAGDRGKKALAALARWEPGKDPEGTVVEVIGPAGEHETEMRAIVLERGFAVGFPPEVEREAGAIPRDIPEREVARRRDFRSVPTMTIDPEDAKDFDDALSVRALAGGGHEVGVHIADVSFFVRPGSAIDREAARRGTSIYLVDRTIPMLPEVLSNDLCSLKPEEDRLAFSAVFTVGPDGAIRERWFGETVIRSAKRFTYEEAEKVLRTGTGPLAAELSVLDGVARKLRDERMREGSIAFEQDEVKFRLDADGRPVGVYKKPRLSTNLLVEDWMLLANREVAAWVYRRSKGARDRSVAFVYRVHDAPDPEKIDELAVFLKAVGYELATHRGAVSSRDINRLFKEIEGKPEENLIKTATIRSMAKAVYSTKNIGHFGLAFRYYTHFTSPIRRYPDLMVHRVMKRHLDGTPISPREFAHYERLAVQSSEREIAAVAAERESVKMKQVEFLAGRVGEAFEGVIAGVAEWGLYVEEKETKAEGLVRIRTLGGDYFIHDEKNYRLVGEKTKRVYRLGDPVRMKLVAADPAAKTLEWELL